MLRLYGNGRSENKTKAETEGSNLAIKNRNERFLADVCYFPCNAFTTVREHRVQNTTSSRFGYHTRKLPIRRKKKGCSFRDISK